MSRWLLVSLALMPSAALAQQQAAPAPPAKLTLYKTANSAACAGDATVWLDPAAGVYYVKGDKLYGKTGRRGGYNCRKQADAAGYRPHGAR